VGTNGQLTVLTIHLGPRAAGEFQGLCKEFGIQFNELIQLALGIASVAARASAKQLKLAIVTPQGKPVSEIVLPALKVPRFGAPPGTA